MYKMTHPPRTGFIKKRMANACTRTVIRRLVMCITALRHDQHQPILLIAKGGITNPWQEIKPALQDLSIDHLQGALHGGGEWFAFKTAAEVPYNHSYVYKGSKLHSTNHLPMALITTR